MIRPLCLAVALLGSALAHEPILNPTISTREQPFELKEPTASKAVFGKLPASGSVFMSMKVPKNFNLSASLWVGRDCPNALQPEMVITFKGETLNVRNGPYRSVSSHGVEGREGPEISTTLGTGTVLIEIRNPTNIPGTYLFSMSGTEEFKWVPQSSTWIRGFNTCKL